VKLSTQTRMDFRGSQTRIPATVSCVEALCEPLCGACYEGQPPAPGVQLRQQGPFRGGSCPRNAPGERRAKILEASTATFGHPSDLPLALAFRIPARTRSAIRLRSAWFSRTPKSAIGRQKMARKEQIAMEMTARGKRGNQRACFPLFPPPLRIPHKPRDSHIPTVTAAGLVFSEGQCKSLT
jgi:hypothetical protein